MKWSNVQTWKVRTKRPSGGETYLSLSSGRSLDQRTTSSLPLSPSAICPSYRAEEEEEEEVRRRRTVSGYDTMKINLSHCIIFISRK